MGQSAALAAFIGHRSAHGVLEAVPG